DLSEGGYRQGTQDAVRSLIDEQSLGAWLGHDGGIFLLGHSRLDERALTMLEAVAVVVLDADEDLDRALAEPSGSETLPALIASAPELAAAYAGEPVERPHDLLLENAYGGFSRDGKEYQIFTEPSDPEAPATPAPWVNVIANER